MLKNKRFLASTALTATAALVLTGCSNTDTAATSADGELTVENCGEEVTFESESSMLAYDGGIIAIALAAGAQDNIIAVSSVGDDRDTLAAKYGADVIDSYESVSDRAPSLEQIIALQPDYYFAGWNYGMSDTNGVDPTLLGDRGIGSYILSESCRQDGTTQRGVMDPWEALDEDLRNIGQISGDPDIAESVIEDQNERLAALADAAQPEEAPNLFLYDSGTDALFTSGKFGAPEVIIQAAGARNHADGIDDTWVQVGWETLAADSPDAFVFVDYPGQSFEEKVEQLKNHPVTRDLPAVQEERFINLPYAMWVSSPLNVDAAEILRKALEEYGLAPESEIQPEFELPASVPGQEYLTK